ncbi:hypothetical protein [Alkalibacterium indicireducens]
MKFKSLNPNELHLEASDDEKSGEARLSLSRLKQAFNLLMST